jgi:hypothetical protein
MNIDANSELLIRRYLLSSVSEEERDQVEMRLMTDDDFFQQINLVEDELVEEYLDEELSEADRGRFETTFLCAPERQQKLRFTRALRVYAAKSQKDPARRSWYERLLTLFNPSRPVLAYALASVLLLVGGGGFWLLVQMSGLREQVSGLRGQLQNREAEESRLRGLFEQERGRANQIAGLLQQEQESRAATPVAMMNQPWFTLIPGAQRSAQSSQLLQIPKGVNLVGLKLDLAENYRETYRAVLWSREQEILSRSNLKAAVSGNAITVSFSVPASDLPGGYCEIRLHGSSDNEIVETYVFRVAKN